MIPLEIFMLINKYMINNKKNYVAFASPIILLLTSLLLAFKFERTDTIRKIIIDFNLPIIDNNGNLFNMPDSLCIFHENDLILYRFPLIKRYEVNNVLIREVVKYQYFGFGKNDVNGMFYDSLDVKQFHRFSVDSILTKRAFKKMNLYDNSKVLVKKQQQSANQIVEKYICTVKKDFTYSDTTFVYYTDKLKEVPYSLSRELDSLSGMKVQKIILLYNAQQYAGKPVKFPERRLSFEMKEVPITNLEEIKSLFERLKEDYKTLKK